MLLRAFVLLLVTLIASLPLLLMDGWRGTEGRRVQIALEMIEHGNWMVPTIGFEPTWAKPPLHYWQLCGILQWFGDDLWLLRMPSVIGLFAMALLAMILLRRWFGEAAGWVGALGVVCSPVIAFEWATAEIDPVFAAFTAMSLWCLATGVARDRRRLVVAAGVLGGLAMLQKGPPYLVFAAGAWLVWWRRRGFRYAVTYFVPLLGLPLCYFVPLWLWWVEPAEMMSEVQGETVGRLAAFTLGRVLETPLFWLRAAFVQFPFVLWCFWEWRGERDARMDPGDLTLRMCSGAAVLAVVLLSFFPGRPTRYLLPNIPLFMFAVAPAVAHFASQERMLGTFSQRILRVIGIAGSVGLVAVPFFVDRFGIAAAGALACAGLAWLLVKTPRQLVIYSLLLPIVVAWTVGIERSTTWSGHPRAVEPLAGLLRRELSALDIADVATFGHVDGKLLLGAGLLPKGDEFCRSQPTAKWLLSTEGGVIGDGPEGYAERLWLTSPVGLFKLHERLPR
ncbi:MAG: glycosyltransferase family 39 protein [Planctomycetes bacterium]|nr:glycosyltransferase family 39 protein [Planctomycetota bacterium]